MSALSFLSKKSWHTGLQTNQKAVWEAEKAALDERKKLDELRKERERERELQELERLHEQSGGKKARRQERVDWMYNAPASGSNVNADELEDYLLGKKRVDKLLKGDETDQLSRASQSAAAAQQPGGSGIASVVNNDRDLASKVREDPMLSIRQQEQAAYQALLKDPARLRAMRKAAGLDVGESKEERRRRKEEKRRRREGREYERHGEDRRDRERGDRYERDDRRSGHADEDRYARRRRDDDYEDRRRDRDYDDRRRDARRTDGDRDHRRANQELESRHRYDDRVQRKRSRSRSRSRSPSRQRPEAPRHSRRSPPAAPAEEDAAKSREAKLAAMQQNASQLSSSRQSYLAKVKADEEADLAREEALRERVRQSRSAGRKSSDGQGFGSSELKGSFMLDQERKMYGSSGGGADVDLAERLRRGRDTLQRFDGD